MKNEKNTFGDYEFESWIPEREQELIRKFWGCFGRTFQDYLDNQGKTELCHHGPNPNGFKIPPNGATCEYFVVDYELSKQEDRTVYIRIKGRYVHRWNNIGSLISESGKSHPVSSCDRWVRILTDESKITINIRKLTK